MSRERRAVVTSTIPLTVRSFHGELLRQLARAGWDPLVVSSPGEDLTVLGRSWRTAAITMRREISPLADLAALVRWVRLLRAERPELLLSATPKASLLAQVAAALVRVPRRVYYMGGLRLEGEHGIRRRVLATAERITAQCASVVIVNSPSLARAVLDARLVDPAALRVIEPGSSHGVDARHFRPQAPDAALAHRLGLDLALPILGFVGRLTAAKGVDALIEALAGLTSQGTAVQLLVVANLTEPDSEAYLRRLQRATGKVVVVESVVDVRPFLALMSVHVLPTRREGFPNVVLEAAGMAVPTVTTTATGAIDSVIDEVSGLLVPVDDPQALQTAIARLLADPQFSRRLGRQARAWVQRCFDPQTVVAGFVQHILDGR
jgi:glycosyltransferase involved in cell wall biosynthesis